MICKNKTKQRKCHKNDISFHPILFTLLQRQTTGKTGAPPTLGIYYLKYKYCGLPFESYELWAITLYNQFKKKLQTRVFISLILVTLKRLKNTAGKKLLMKRHIKQTSSSRQNNAFYLIRQLNFTRNAPSLVLLQPYPYVLALAYVRLRPIEAPAPYRSYLQPRGLPECGTSYSSTENKV